jgi:hypothetical protein
VGGHLYHSIHNTLPTAACRHIVMVLQVAGQLLQAMSIVYCEAMSIVY